MVSGYPGRQGALHSFDSSPDALGTDRSTPRRTASSSPTTVTVFEARVTAV